MVFAAREKTGLAAGDAAHIVAEVLIADGAAVDAVHQHAAGKAGDAAAVGDHVFILRVEQIQAVGGDGRQIVQAQHLLRHFDVDRAQVFAAADQPLAVADDAAGEALAADLRVRAAADDGAVALAHKTAHIVAAAHRALKAAVFQCAVTGANDAADLVAALVGQDAAAHPQVADEALALQIAEQAQVGPALQLHAVDAVPAAVEGPGKNGDGDRVAPQIQVTVQHDREAFGVAVQRAVAGQAAKSLHAGNVDRFAFGRSRRAPDGCQQQRRQQQG